MVTNKNSIETKEFHYEVKSQHLVSRHGKYPALAVEVQPFANNDEWLIGRLNGLLRSKWLIDQPLAET